MWKGAGGQNTQEEEKGRNVPKGRPSLRKGGWHTNTRWMTIEVGTEWPPGKPRTSQDKVWWKAL